MKEREIKVSFLKSDYAREKAMDILANAIAASIIKDENAGKVSKKKGV